MYFITSLCIIFQVSLHDIALRSRYFYHWRKIEKNKISKWNENNQVLTVWAMHKLCTRSHFKTHRIQKLQNLKYPSESSYKCGNEKNTSNTNNKWYSIKQY